MSWYLARFTRCGTVGSAPDTVPATLSFALEMLSKGIVATFNSTDPFPAASKDHPTRLGVCFFHKALKWPAALLHPVDEKVAAVGSALIIDYGAGISVSKLKVEKHAGATMTQRNWNTVLGIWQRMKDR